MLDLGLAAIEAISLVSVVFLTVNLIMAEIEIARDLPSSWAPVRRGGLSAQPLFSAPSRRSRSAWPPCP